MKSELIKSPLSLGNAAFRSGKYLEAIKHYEEALIESPALRASIEANIALARRRLESQALGADNGVVSFLSSEAQVDYIVAEKPQAQPDFFTLKAREPRSTFLVLAWVPNVLSLINLTKRVAEIKVNYELLVLAPRSLVEQHKLKRLSDKCLWAGVIGFPEKTGKSGAFVRVLLAGVIAKYEDLLWLDCKEADFGKSSLTGECIELFLRAATQKNVGLVADKLDVYTGKEPDIVNNNVGVWYSRLLRKKPKQVKSIPKGNFAIRTFFLKQLSALNLNPPLFDSLSESDDDLVFKSIRITLGAFLEEGRFSSLEVNEAAAKLKQPSKRLPREVKTIAFFLPQFHIIPENNSWWGKGFTEWNNVIRARPLFRNHYQPRLPADLGFYDLRSQQTQIAQAELANRFGIHGFCYYYYWFNGKKLLNEPIENMFHSGKPDFPFCVCWANENWSRNWDGQNKHVLLEQTYSIESNLALIRELIPMMKDPRYIRHNGKPVLLVYRIKVIPNWLETAALWREECRKAGVGEIHLCAIRFGLEPLEGMPSQHGLDSYVLFPPQDMKFVDAKASVLDLNKDFGGTIYSYDEVVEGDISRFASGYPWPVHRGAMLGWDNTARRLTDSRIFVGCTPTRYRAWLDQILEQECTHNPENESLIFINAWNEWAEGTVLEPDQRFSTSYLEATRSVLARYKAPALGAHTKDASKDGENDKNDHSFEETNKTRKYVKEVEVSRAFRWYEGEAELNADAPTILLCAHISGHHLFGGERSFLDVLNALRKIGFNVVVTLPSDNNKQYLEYIQERTLGVYVFPYRQWVLARDMNPTHVLMFADIIITHNISIVYSNTIVLVEPALAAARMGRVSVVHARELITLDDALRERIGLPVQTIIKTVFDRYNFIVANSMATKSIFSRGDATFYVPNAVDADTVYSENEIGKVVKFGIVSSNIPKKGVSDFIEVAKLCVDLSGIAEFVVIGPDNPQIESWKKDVKEGRLPSHIKFLGYKESPKEAIAELNVLLSLSSFAESFGRTVAEAMAAKRAVIAYEWGAVPELVVHGETGYLVPFGDRTGVAKYVKQLCKDRALIKSLGEAGYKRAVMHYSQESLLSNMKRAMSCIQDSSVWKQVSESYGVKPRCGSVTIVVPVYNAPEEVDLCLESVLAHTSTAHTRIIVINDGSTDKKIPDILDRYKNRGVVVLHNATNIGYTKTVNRGLKEAGSDDVVLLNSDAIVTPGWLSGLKATAYSSQDIGTVTAMSDNAGAFSFPVQGAPNPKPEHMSREEYAVRVIDKTFDCAFVDVPTGSGFCMYIRRALIDDIGNFDDVLFPRGYGEENDFCMRALQAGWRNLITPWVFVYHKRTASFKGEKEKLVKQGVDAVTKKYPDYAEKTKKAFSSEAIKRLRECFNGL